MDFLKTLFDDGVFKDYKLFIPVLTITAAMIIDHGFFYVDYIQWIKNPTIFIPLAFLIATGAVGFFYLMAYSLLLMAKFNERPRVSSITDAACILAAFSLIVFSLTGAGLAVASFIGQNSPIITTHDQLNALHSVNLFWYVSAFLVGRELLRLVTPQEKVAH